MSKESISPYGHPFQVLLLIVKLQIVYILRAWLGKGIPKKSYWKKPVHEVSPKHLLFKFMKILEKKQDRK